METKLIEFIKDHNIHITKAEFCETRPELYYGKSSCYEVHFRITLNMNGISWLDYYTVSFPFIEQWLKSHEITVKYPESTEIFTKAVEIDCSILDIVDVLNQLDCTVINYTFEDWIRNRYGSTDSRNFLNCIQKDWKMHLRYVEF